MVGTPILITIVALIAVAGTASVFILIPNLPEALGNIAPTQRAEIPVADLPINEQEDLADQIDTIDESNNDETTLGDGTVIDYDDPEFHLGGGNPNDTPIGDDPLMEDVLEDVVNAPDPNEPVTSEDDTATQLGDETDSPVLPTTEGVTLVAEVTTTDSTGNQVVETFEQEFVGLSLIEDISNADFSNGTVTIRMWAQADPDELITGDGQIDIQINQQGLFVGKPSISFAGRGDQDGRVVVEFTLPDGTKTSVIDFAFAEKIDLLPIDTRSPIKVTVENVNANIELRDEFVIDKADVFSLDILNTEDATFITELDGSKVRIFPSDDIIKVSSLASIVQRVQFNSYASYLGSPAPPMGAVTITEKESGLVIVGSEQRAFAGFRGSLSECGKVPNTASSVRPCIFPITDHVIDFSKLARDTTYTVTVGEPTPATWEFTTPLSQKNYDWSCIHDTSIITEFGGARNYIDGGGYAYWKEIIRDTDGKGGSIVGIDDTPITCNFPVDGNSTSLHIENGITYPPIDYTQAQKKAFGCGYCN